MSKCEVKILGRVGYREAWELQKELVAKRKAGEILNTLVLLEHNPVFTIGRNGSKGNLLVNEDALKKVGTEVFEVDRGGDITYHGPGQLVGYPIIDLREFRYGIKSYVYKLEDALIDTLSHYGIEGARKDGLRGVWVGESKIAAIGARVSKWITSHGFALNITTNLDYFKLIIPCGIAKKGVTSIAKETGKEHPLNEVARVYAKNFAETFKCEIVYEKEYAQTC